MPRHVEIRIRLLFGFLLSWFQLALVNLGKLLDPSVRVLNGLRRFGKLRKHLKGCDLVHLHEQPRLTLSPVFSKHGCPEWCDKQGNRS
eukprot:895936-Amphidinium_carterae.1